MALSRYIDGSRVVYWNDSNGNLTVPGTLTASNIEGASFSLGPAVQFSSIQCSSINAGTILNGSNTSYLTYTNTTAPASDGTVNGIAITALNQRVRPSLGEQLLFTSSMGAGWTTWTQRTAAANYGWRKVAWSPTLKLYCAVCSSPDRLNNIMTSPDGITWTLRTTPNALSFGGIIWADTIGRFVAIAINASSQSWSAVSTDGITWNTYLLPTSGFWLELTWSPQLSRMVAVSFQGGVRSIAYSSDGQTWTTIHPNSPSTTNRWYGICWSAEVGLFVAVSPFADAGANRCVMTSPDGISWTQRTVPATKDWYSVAWSPELKLFAAVSRTGDTQGVMTSPDGVTWTMRSTPAHGFTYITWMPELSMFAVLNETNASVTVSRDGITWIAYPVFALAQRYYGMAWSREQSKLVITVDSTVAPGIIVTSEVALPASQNSLLFTSPGYASVNNSTGLISMSSMNISSATVGVLSGATLISTSIGNVGNINITQANVSTLSTNLISSAITNASTINVNTISSAVANISTINVNTISSAVANISTINVKTLVVDYVTVVSTAIGNVTTLNATNISSAVTAASTINTNTISTNTGAFNTVNAVNISSAVTAASTINTNTISTNTGAFNTVNAVNISSAVTAASTINTNTISSAVVNISSVNAQSFSTAKASIAALNVSSIGGFSPINITDALLTTSSIGIGTTNPFHPLHISTNVINTGLNIDNPVNPTIRLYTSYFANSRIGYISMKSGASDKALQFWNGATDISAGTDELFKWLDPNTSTIMSLRSNGALDSAAINTINISSAIMGTSSIQLFNGKTIIGSNAGAINPGTSVVAVGQLAGNSTQGAYAVAIGKSAGEITQKGYTVAIGIEAGYSNQGIDSVAIGVLSGSLAQGSDSVAVGQSAGYTSQGSNSVAIGRQSGYQSQGVNGIAIGQTAGYDTQGNNAIAIGSNAGNTNQGSNAIAIGFGAGETNQVANSIILNASNVALNAATNAGFYVNPVRNVATTNVVYYNTTTKEVTYGAVVSSFNSFSTGTASIGALNVSSLGGFSPIQVRDALILNSSITASSITTSSATITNLNTTNITVSSITFSGQQQKSFNVTLGQNVNNWTELFSVSQASYSSPVEIRVCTYNNTDLNNLALTYIIGMGYYQTGGSWYECLPIVKSKGFGVNITNEDVAIDLNTGVGGDVKFRLRRRGTSAYATARTFVVTALYYEIPAFPVTYTNLTANTGSNSASQFYNGTALTQFEGRVGINFVNPTTYDLTLANNSAAKPTSDLWTISSDRRIKEDIQVANLDICYSTMRSLQLYYYKYKDGYVNETQEKDRHVLGFIAQDVYDVLPKSVTISPKQDFTFISTMKDGNQSTFASTIWTSTLENFYSLNGDQIYKMQFGAIQKMMQLIDSQSARISTLESKISALSS